MLLLFPVLALAQVHCPYGASTDTGRGCVTNWSPNGKAVMAPSTAAGYNSMVAAPPPGVSVSNCVCSNGQSTSWVWYGQVYASMVPWQQFPADHYCRADRGGNQGFTYNGYCLRNQTVHSFGGCTVE